MSKKFIVFAGVIFIIVFGVMQIAVISILGVNANINLDRTIAIFSGFFSLFGGIIGATGAYFIAREQIRKQDSMRKIDWKINNYTLVIELLNCLISEVTGYSKKITNLSGSSALIFNVRLKDYKHEHEGKVEKLAEDMYKHKIAFSLIGYNYDEIIFLRNNITNIFELEFKISSMVSEKEVSELTNKIAQKLNEFERIIEEFEDEIEEIITK